MLVFTGGVTPQVEGSFLAQKVEKCCHPSQNLQVSNEKTTGCLGCIGDEILPSFVGILINHYKDPYEPTSISWKVSGRVFFVAQLLPPQPKISELNLGLTKKSRKTSQL